MREPTGHEIMHMPQYSQSKSPPEKGSMEVCLPRPITFMADAPWSSAQTRVHLVHMMQRSMFLTMSGSLVLSGSVYLGSENLPAAAPYITEKSWRSHSPALSHVGQSRGWLMSMNSNIAFLAACISGVSVSTTIPSSASRVHEACSLRVPSIRTRHMRHPPKLSIFG